MARLGAKEKALFYPTPLNVMDLIVSNLSYLGGRATILDPCAGTGEPLAYLAEHLSLISYGNELDPGRYEQVKSRVLHCLSGPRELLTIEGQFNILFDNPPYDQSLGGERMEMEHIRLDLELLVADGLGIWILPETIFSYELCSLLTLHLAELVVRRFPMPEYEQFKQVVVFGIKRPQPLGYSYSLSTDLEQKMKAGVPPLQHSEYSFKYSIEPIEITRFDTILPEAADVLAEVERYGVETTPAWQVLFGADARTVDGVSRPSFTFQPVLPLNSGHMAFVIAAGIVDGTEVEIDGAVHIIKGNTEKQIAVTVNVEAVEAGTKETVRERQRLAHTLAALNIENGSLVQYNSLEDKEGFSAFLLQHQDHLVQMVDDTYPPLFEPDRDMPAWVARLDRVHAPGRLPGHQSMNGLLPAQEVRAAALAARLKTDKAVVLVGEMGSGKSAISAAVSALIGKGNWKLVIVCPSQIVHKWKREAEKVLRSFEVKAHIIGHKHKQPDGEGKLRMVSKPVLDVMTAMEEETPSILVMSYETAKNGPRWEHAVQERNRTFTHEVEKEVVTQHQHYPFERKEIVTEEVATVQEVLGCPDCGLLVMGERTLLTKSELGSRKLFCTGCGAALWQQVPFKYGGRTAIADFLNRHYAGEYNLILDEAHHVKGSDTDAGYASTDLISAARKVIAMTGTIYAGKASSIFYLLYRLLPRFRQLYAYNEVQRFIDHHGLQETITTSTPQKQWSSTYGYNRENVRTREIAGVSPGMVTMLLTNTAFIKLADMGLNLPTYVEERYPIPLDERLEAGLKDIANIYEEAAKLARRGKPGLLSSWLYASLGWMDCPVDELLEGRDREGKVVASYEIEGILGARDELLDDPLSKDYELVHLISGELAQGRGVGVYFAQVNRRDWMTRVHKLLKAEGIYSEVLRQGTCKPDQRELWYQDMVKRSRLQGQEPVLLANGNLVKEGLDLVELPTLIETGIEYRINDLRQRDRRSWRLTQGRPVKVIFLYYEDSPQEAALQLVAAKLKAALMVDGNLAEGLAAMDVDDGNLMDALMKAVSQRKRPRLEWDGMTVARVLDAPASVVVEVAPEPAVSALKKVKVGDQIQYSFL